MSGAHSEALMRAEAPAAMVAELVAAGGLHLLWEMAVELRRRCVWLEGIGEHADALKPPLPGEVDHLLKLRIGLAGKANDEV